ncbi:hypothetical protein ACQEVC_15690 [Plantactinospora sp. CA-294935]
MINIDDNYYGGNPHSQLMFLKVFFSFATGFTTASRRDGRRTGVRN